MKVKTLKRTGWILIFAGLIGVSFTAAKIYVMNTTMTIDSSPALAQAISNTLATAAVGALVTLTGLILLLSGWRTKHTMRL
ncbi:MAG: hypothetical protein HN758_02110 [Verrucomicrobia bacterium]|nr:hypothetical protein [Verrucomicrobiota bacterium]MBT6239742.1 hypothetical protein [Verrucomicrobiota bacterium]MBT7873200.1 hypothetical protein [Verrucomicrobiota bacterium]